MSGVVGQIKEAGINAAQILVGKAATKVVSDKIPFGPTSGPIAIAKQVAVGTALSIAVRRFAGNRFALNFLTGAILVPLEATVKSLNIPIISPALSAYPQGAPQLRGYDAYPQLTMGDMGGAGDEGDDAGVLTQMYGS